MGHLSNSMRMFLLWTIFLLFAIPNESKHYLVKTNDSDTDNIEPIQNPDYKDSDDSSNESDGWGDESIDESWDTSEEATKGSSKKEGTTQTTQTTRAATTEETIEITSEETSTLPTGDGTGVADIPGSFTTTIGGYSYSNSEHAKLSCSYYGSGAMVQGQICLAPLGGWRTCRFPPDDCNLDWPKLYKDLKIAYEEHKEKMRQLDRNMKKMNGNMAKQNEKMKENMDRNMKKMDEDMAKMNEKFSRPCFP